MNLARPWRGRRFGFGDLLALLFGLACALEAGAATLPGLEIAIEGGEAVLFDDYAALTRERAAWLEQRFGMRIVGKVRGQICLSDACFSRFSTNKHFSAIASAPRGLIVLHLGRLRFDPDAVSSTLTHELVHLLVGQLDRACGACVPLWFNEGLAQHYAGGVSEFDSQGSADAIFYNAVVRRAVFRFSQLEARFPPYFEEMTLAYEQSRRFLLYLVEEQGGEVALLRLLRGLEDGLRFDEAYREVYGREVEETMADWRNSFPVLPALLLYIATNADNLLWGATSLLMVVALILARRRHLRKREQLDEDPEERLRRHRSLLH